MTNYSTSIQTTEMNTAKCGGLHQNGWIKENDVRIKVIPSPGQEKTVKHNTQRKKQLRRVDKAHSPLQTLYFNLMDEEIKDGREKDAGNNKIQQVGIGDKRNPT